MGINIAFITESFPVLSETFILGKAAALRKRGHDLTVFTQFRREMDVHPELLSDLREKDMVKLPAWDRVRGKDVFRSFRGLGFHPLRTLSLASKVMTTARSGKGLALVKSLPFLRKKYDIIHAHYAHMGTRYQEAADMLSTPLIVSLLGREISCADEKQLKSYSRMFESAALIFASSRYLEGLAVEAGCPRDKVRILYPEVDTDYFSYIDRDNLGSGKIRLLSVCRLDWSKGLPYSLEAVRILIDRDRDVSYRIVGEGNARAEVELAIRDMGLEKAVTLTGAKNRQGCRNEMEEADIFLMPSVTESFGLAAAEAQATGLPVVTSRVGGLPEVVRDKETGFTVPSRDPEAIAGKVEYLIDNPEERLKMGKNGKAWVDENFRRDIIMEQMIDAYEKVAGKGISGP